MRSPLCARGCRARWSACALLAIAGPVSAALNFQGQGPTPSIESVVTVPTNGTWIVLEEVMQSIPGGTFYSPIYTFSTNATSVQVDVTDLFAVSDRNELWFGLPAGSTLVGATPVVLDWSSLPSAPATPFVDPPYTTDPDVAWTRPEFSKSSFTLTLSGSGPYFLRLKNIHIPPISGSTPFDTGTVAFRIVPEPSTVFLFVPGFVWLARRRRGIRFFGGAGVAIGLLAASWPSPAYCGPPVASAVTSGGVANSAALGGPCLQVCGAINGSVSSGKLTLSWASATTDESLRVLLNGAVVEVYSPATSATPCASFDSTASNCAFTQIKVEAGSGNDLIVFDDSNGSIVQAFATEIDGGDGTDTIAAGVSLTAIPLSQLLADVNQFRQDVENTLPESRVENLIDAGARLLDTANSTMIQPGVQCAQNVRPTLIEPMRQIVRSTVEQEILSWVNFVSNDAEAIRAEATTLNSNIDANVVDVGDVMVLTAWNLVAAGQALYAHAANMGTTSQSGNPEVFVQTVENYIATLEFWADQCNDPDQPPNDPDAGNENAQLPSGLPYPCDELETLIEQLEGVIDQVEARNDTVEQEGDALEAAADEESGGSGSLEGVANGLENNVDVIETQIEGMENDGETLSNNADTKATAEEAWGAAQEATLAAGGNSMEQCLQSIDDAAASLETAAAAFEATAMTIPADVETLLSQPTIAMLTMDPVLAAEERGTTMCNVPLPLYTVEGGPGNDIIIGTLLPGWLVGGPGADLILGGPFGEWITGGAGRDFLFGGGGVNTIYGDGEFDSGDKSDLVVGGNTTDCLFGDDGNDLLIARGGRDYLDGGDKIDVLFGGGSDDRMYGGAGETRTVLSLKFELGSLFFGEGGNDEIVGGDDDILHPDAPILLPGIDIAFGMAGDDKILVGDGGNMTTTASQPPCPFPIKLGNLVFGGAGADTIVGKDGIDVLFGGDGDDTITAGKGHLFSFDCNHNSQPELKVAFGDLIFGRAGEDTINGDDPDGDRADDDIDLIFGGGDADEINGFDGGKIEVDSDEDGSNEFEMRMGNMVFGGSGDDVITTGKGIDLIFGGPDGDTIEAGYGDRLKFGDSVVIDFGDLIFGQGGADTIHGDTSTAPESTDPDEGEVDGIDLIFAGDDDDVVYSSDGGLFAVGDISDPSSITLAFTFGNLVFGGDGNDQIFCRYENPSTSGGDDNETAGIDLVFGGGGDDEIEGGKGSLIYISPAATPTLIPFGNMMFGGPGADTIKGAGGAPAPADILPVDPEAIPVPDGTLADYLEGMDLIFAGTGDDRVESYDGIDIVFGWDGDDELVAENGGVMLIAATPIPFGNLIFGNEGKDIIRSAGRAALLEADLIFGGPCDDNISAGGGLLNIVFGGRHNDTITAGGDSTSINLLFGNRGDDTIGTTGTGINLMFGNRGRDTITGGDGLNVAFGNRDDDVLSAGLGLSLLFGNRGNDTVSGGSNSLGVYLLFGNRGSDTVNGGNGINLAFGNACNDVVNGGIGVNLLFGNKGEDQVDGGSGLTLSFGNRDKDRLTAGSGLTLQFGNRDNDRIVMGSGVGLAFGGIGNDIVCGGSGKAIAFGGQNDDVIMGGTDLNILFGNAGDDWIAGGDNATDIIFGNRNNDTIFGRGGPRDLLFGNADHDQIDGEDGKDYIFGNGGDDDLQSGGGGSDWLFGNRGNDNVFSGPDGSGGDRLFGNRGNDHVDGHPNPGPCGDKRYGNRGNNTKTCDGTSVSFAQPNPKHGVIRGYVRLDKNFDSVGDVGHGSVTVTLSGNSINLTTISLPDDDDCYSDVGSFAFGGLPPGTYTICQTPPSGYSAVSPASGCSNVTIDPSCGGGLVENLMLVNRADGCTPSANGFGCTGACTTSQPADCHPTVVRQVDRCATTGEICTADSDCPCGTDCVPSWEVVECGCSPTPTCHVAFDAANQPGCAGGCNDGTACQLVQDGNLYSCQCPCGTELASMTFEGLVRSVQGCAPIPVPINVDDHWQLRYWFARFAPDQNPSPQLGEYGILHYELRINNVVVSSGAAPPTSLISVFDDAGGLTGQQDAYQAHVVTALNPQAAFDLRLVDQTNALASDHLPLCNELDLAQFTGCCGGPALPACTVCGTGLSLTEPCRCFVWQTVTPPVCPGGFRIRGSVDTFECTNCAPQPLRACPGDLNGDGIVGSDDAPLFVAELLSGASCGGACRADVDGSGGIDGTDIQVFVGGVVEGRRCP